MRSAALLLAITLPALVACEEKVEAPPPPVRAIKTMVIAERVGKQERKIAGIVEASTVTDLAFEISGRVVELEVDIGDQLKAGDTVAGIDPVPYQIAFRSAESEVDDAEGRLKDAESKFTQQDTLYKKGYTTKTSLDTARANLNSSKAALEGAQSRRDTAQRNLTLTTLTAPFDGRVSEKFVERFTEIASGQKVVQLSAGGQRKVEATVPEAMISDLKVGDTVTVGFPTLPDKIVTGKISQIGSRAGASSSFPVIAVLDEEDPLIRAGMTAEVTFAFETEATGNAFVIPIPSVLPTGDKGTGLAFVFDPAANVVRQREVQIVNIKDNDLVVAGGLSEGDIIAIAGTSFLHDGMKVKLLDPSQGK